MTKHLIITALLLIILLPDCQRNDGSLFDVSGYLTADGQILESATVNIDGLEQYKTTTNAEGFFEIKNVSSGDHELNAKKEYNDGKYILKSFNIVVNTDLNFQELLLPNPVSLDIIELDSITNDITLKWNRSVAEDFREYKVYSHNTSGLDEVTGTLDHVATESTDTIIKLKVANSMEKFFRVFVLNEFGQLGGSNIRSVTGVNINLIAGGDFEDEDLFNKYWLVSPGTGTVKIVDTIAFQGKSCLIMQNIISPDFSYDESFINTSLQLMKDIEYRLSFHYKIKGIARMDYNTLFFYYIQYEEKHLETNLSVELPYDTWKGEWIPNGPFKILDETDWLYYSKTFVPDSDSPARFYFGGQIENILIDDLEIKVNE